MSVIGKLLAGLAPVVKEGTSLATLKSQSPEYRQKVIAQIGVVCLAVFGIEMSETDLLAALAGVEAVYLVIRKVFPSAPLVSA